MLDFNPMPNQNPCIAQYTEAISELSKRFTSTGIEDSKVNFVKAKSLLKFAADKGNTNAMVAYGKLCEKNKQNKFGSIQQNFKEAFRYFQLSSKLGNADGMANYGHYYISGKVVRRNQTLGTNLYRQSYERGSIKGLALYAGSLIYGDGCLIDEEEGLKLTKIACERNEPAGWNTLGMIYFEGRCNIEKNEYEATKFFKKAAELGLASAMNNYACSLRDGSGSEKDIDRAIDLYKMAFDEGAVLAARNLSKIYLTLDLYKNYLLGLSYLKLAAERYDYNALYDYVMALYTGEMVEADLNESIRMLKFGIECGDVDSIRLYGAFLLDGDKLPKNSEEGAKYYKMAADMGDESAICDYGYLLEMGEGVKEDYQMALSYYRKSADLGYEDAKIKYNDLIEKMKQH